MTDTTNPIYLFSDSQILFCREDSSPYMQSVRSCLGEKQKSKFKAAYIGVANNDEPSYFELFTAAMNNIGNCDCTFVKKDFSEEGKDNLRHADLILLAGGDVHESWMAMCARGIDKILFESYYQGKILMGVSAGAVQLGLGYLHEGAFSKAAQIVPYYIDAHQEDNVWKDLRKIVKNRESFAKGYGLNFGSGMIYHPDATVEPLQKSISEFYQASEISAHEDEATENADSTKRQAQRAGLASNILLPVLDRV